MEFRIVKPEKVIIGDTGHETIGKPIHKARSHHNREHNMDHIDALMYATAMAFVKQTRNNNTEDVEYTDVTNDPEYAEGAETTGREITDGNPITIEDK